MKLEDLITPIDKQSDEELLERLRVIRHNRTVERPAVKAREEKAEKKTVRSASKKATSKVDKMLGGMSEADRLKLIALLSSGEGNGN